MSQSLSEETQALLAGYVLGDLSAEEMDRVEQLLGQNPDLLQEVKAMQVSLQLVPHALPTVAPPPQLQEKILSANAATIKAPEPSLKLPRSFPWGKLIAGIATVAALLLGADNFRLRRKLNLAQQSDIQRVAAILQRPKSRLIALEGEGGSAAAGTLLFTPGQWQEVIVSLGNLPPLSPDQIYRMWLSLANGETLLCGEFKTDAQGSVFVKFNPPKMPPKGVKATGIFVTVDAISAPLEPTGQQVLFGEL